MNKRMIIVTSAGFIIGIAEALIYYNLGKQKGKLSLELPERKELMKTMGIVLTTSVITAALVYGIEKTIPENNPSLAMA